MSRQQKWAERIRDVREAALLEGEEWDHVDAELAFLCRMAYMDGVMDGLHAVPAHPPAHVSDAWRIRLFEAVIATLDEGADDDEGEEIEPSCTQG